MSGHDTNELWILQVSVALPAGCDPIDLPELTKLEDAVRTMVAGADSRVRVDSFTVNPGAVRAGLIDTLDFHRLEPDGTCRCGSPLLGLSHAEHVAGVFEESTRARATM